MAVRYPLVIDTTDNNKIKELPLNDSLNLSTNSIVNAVNITASGTLTVANLVVDTNSVSINGNSIATVALTNSYTDLSNKPSLFDGQYASLTGRPTIVSTTEDLADVSSTQATNGQALIYNSTSGVYEPGSIADAALDLTGQSISELADVAVISIATNQVLKWTGATFANSNVAFSELTGTPTTLSGYGITNAYTKAEVDAQISAPTGDLTGSVFGDDSTLLVDSINNKIVGTVDANISRSGTLVVSGDSVNIVTTAGGLLLSSSAGATLLGSGTTSIVSSAGQIDITANSTVNLSGSLFNVFTGMTVRNGIDGDLTGSVFADDSTLLVDGVNGEIPAENVIGTLPTLKGSVQEIIGPGVIKTSTLLTEIITTGVDSFTLANGTYGQIKIICKIGGASAATIIPATFANGTSIEFNANNDNVTMIYTNSGWMIIAGQSYTVNP